MVPRVRFISIKIFDAKASFYWNGKTDIVAKLKSSKKKPIRRKMK
jgi:hypothetical protein